MTGEIELLELLELLERGDVRVLGSLTESSNATFLVEVSRGEDTYWAIFKPEAGEQPLHDFEPGLWRRERAAYLLSEWLAWGIVPPTVAREVEPFGVGSLQAYVDNDGSHYFPLLETRPDLNPQFRRMAVFDLLANNTDRKSGHVLLGNLPGTGSDEQVWGIDHGLCFHQDPKLRTVIWDFAHEEVEAELVDTLAPLVDVVPDEVASLLTEPEVAALRARASRIVRLPWLPEPRSHYQFPWPLV